ncbi:energy transducer TonB [Pelagicoccus sp. SDUM812002]|uniref:energy transducer TonB n=1 Tax=Pelagicoccus sp. SDUM812002 TaxID=3041266 RepID=UPI00280FC3EA|nr:energy transducer TonB [Pelagicoccus sp. SDUM812002]MDQ8186991.1 energy transducer TonB [Pelagicoccus sp. SDUM812002]
MSTMGTQLRRVALAAILLSLASLTRLAAETLVSTDGNVYEGTIDYANEKEVTLKTSEGGFVSAAIADLDSDSSSTVQRWMEENPELCDVYSTWDQKPSVVRSRVAVTPPQLNAPGFKGLVSLQVILDETGKVSHAAVSKSTHDELEDAAVEAMRKWSFKPAQVAGKNVKARIAISFKFEA